MPERWTRAVLRRRIPILLCWIAVVAVGAFGATRLTALLATSFAVPGTDSEHARTILANDFRERTDGVFTVVFATRGDRPQLRARLAAAADVVPTGHVGQLLSTRRASSWAEIQTTLDLQHAKRLHARHPRTPSPENRAPTSAASRRSSTTSTRSSRPT